MGANNPRPVLGTQRSAKWLQATTRSNGKNDEGMASVMTSTGGPASRSMVRAMTAYANSSGKTPVQFVLTPRPDGRLAVVACPALPASPEPASPLFSPRVSNAQAGSPARASSSSGSPKRYASLDRLSSSSRPFDARTRSGSSVPPIRLSTTAEAVSGARGRTPWGTRTSMTPSQALLNPKMDVNFGMNTISSVGNYHVAHLEGLKALHARRPPGEPIPAPPPTPPSPPKPLAEKQRIHHLRLLRGTPASSETTAWREDEKLQELSRSWDSRQSIRDRQMKRLNRMTGKEFSWLERRAKNHLMFQRWMQLEDTNRLFSMARWDAAELIQRAWRAKIRARAREERRLQREAEMAAAEARAKREAAANGKAPGDNEAETALADANGYTPLQSARQVPPDLKLLHSKASITNRPGDAIRYAIETLKRIRKSRIKNNPEAHLAHRVQVHAISSAVDGALANEEWLEAAAQADADAAAKADSDDEDSTKPRIRFWNKNNMKKRGPTIDSIASSQAYLQQIQNTANYRVMRKSKWFRSIMKLDG